MKATQAQLRAALDRPDGAVRLFLLYGPDEAGARALAAQLGRAMGAGAERVDLEPATLRSDPARLADEAAALSLFGEARYVRVEGIGEESADAVAALLDAPRAGNPVVAIGPGLKATGRLVKLALAAQNALAFACYVPEAADAERIVEGLARALGLRLAGGIARRIVAAAGGDRAVMARELEKLALYLDAAPDRPCEVDDAAIAAIGAEVGDGEMTVAIEAAIDGRVADLIAELSRLEETGTSPVPLLRQLVRRLMALAAMRAEVDAGAAAASVIDRHRVFWKEKPATVRALRRWPAPRLAEAIGRARAGERAIMGGANAGSVLAAQALTGIARVAARLDQQG